MVKNCCNDLSVSTSKIGVIAESAADQAQGVRLPQQTRSFAVGDCVDTYSALA